MGGIVTEVTNKTFSPKNPDRLNLFENLIFKGKNAETYEILADKLIEVGGESQIYQAKQTSNEEPVVAKIYDNYENSPINRENIFKFLSENSNYQETHIMPLLDYGMISIPSDAGDNEKSYRIDILPYIKDGYIKRATYDELKGKIIPGIIEALKSLHTAKFVHRDIKPENIYFYKDCVILADFGTASEISNTPYNISTTRQGRGTLGYTPPEVWQGYAVTASDYFSLGCTIATLYKGEHPYQNLLNFDDAGTINNAINNEGLPLNCPKSQFDLQMLVDSLTIMDAKKRPDYDAVKLWLKDSSEFIKKYKREKPINDDTWFTFTFVNDIVCHKKQELIDALSSHWKYAKDSLYQGGVNNSTIRNLFASIDQALAVNIGKIIETGTASTYDLGLAQTLHFLNDSGPFYWKGKTYKKLSEISDAISSKAVSIDEIASMLKSKYLSWKLENTKVAVNNDVLLAVQNLEKISEKYEKFACYFAMYQFAPLGETKNYRGLKTPEEIFNSISKCPYEFYQNHKVLFDDNEMFSYLAYLGFQEKVINLKDKLKGKPSDDFELLYRFFESICTDKTVIRKHYCTYGPKAHLFWLQNNLGLYSFNTNRAQEIKQKIQNIQISPDKSIDELYENFMKLTECQKDFISLFPNNILLAYLGIFGGAEITSDNSDAYYVEELCGSRIPTGYLR